MLHDYMVCYHVVLASSRAVGIKCQLIDYKVYQTVMESDRKIYYILVQDRVGHLQERNMLSFGAMKSTPTMVLKFYRKIPKINPGAYICQKPFLRGLFLDGAYIRRSLFTEENLRFKIYWASLIFGSKFTVFALSQLLCICG